jgi:hypothetical protein
MNSVINKSAGISNLFPNHIQSFYVDHQPPLKQLQWVNGSSEVLIDTPVLSLDSINDAHALYLRKYADVLCVFLFASSTGPKPLENFILNPGWDKLQFRFVNYEFPHNTRS